MQEAVNRQIEQLRFESEGGGADHPDRQGQPAGPADLGQPGQVPGDGPDGRPGDRPGPGRPAGDPLGPGGRPRRALVEDQARRSSRSPRCPTSGPARTGPTRRPSSGWPGSSRAWTTSAWRSATGGCVAGEGRCVMITSATGGEGKTTLSAHLAARCANARTSTLLIDADIRRASLGRLLDVPPGAGLGDVLAGDVDLRRRPDHGPGRRVPLPLGRGARAATPAGS